MSTTQRYRSYSSAFGACLLAMTQFGCASQPVKCEMPQAPASLLQPVETTDKLTELGLIFNRDWSNTEQDARRSDSK